MVCFFLRSNMSSSSFMIYSMNCDVLNNKSSPMKKMEIKVKVPGQ